MNDIFNGCSKLNRSVVSVGLLVILALCPGISAGQTSAQLNRFRAAETPDDDLNISRPTFYDHLGWGVQLHLDYALNPLVWEEQLGDSDTEIHHIVEHHLTANIGFSLGLFDWVVVYAGFPVTLAMTGVDRSVTDDLGVPAADGTGPGDVYLGVRVRLYGLPDDIFAIALQTTATFPTGGDQAYRGDDFLSVHPELIMEVRPRAARITLDVGAYVRRGATSPTTNFVVDDELTLGLGFAIPVWTDDTEENTHLDIQANLFGSLTFQDFAGRETSSFEGLGGLRFHHASGFSTGFGVGPGIARGVGTPDVRAVLMASYARPQQEDRDTDGDGLLDSVDQCPTEPEDMDNFEDENGCPDPDNDQDGILDVDDDCPMEPETVNEFEDEDGCPDEVPDTDGDGLLDPDDECPTEPEDMDEFEDEDGCPDPDNDQDGVLDVDDECPMEPGPVENRGCPDTDRDEDTVVDRLDNCPDEPGSVDNHGCRVRQRVRIEIDRLDIMERVFFRTNRDVIQPRSFALLENVAQVLNAHPEIALVRVEGHTDSRGRRQYNLDLSQRRAEAVVRFLVERGNVDPSRLEAQGFGPDRPRVEGATTAAEHAQNRRVEFNIPGGSEDIQIQENEATSDTIDR